MNDELTVLLQFTQTKTHGTVGHSQEVCQITGMGVLNLLRISLTVNIDRNS